MATSSPKLFLLLLLAIFFYSSNASTKTLHANLSSLKSLCKTTPYPDACFNSSKLSISININPNILNTLLQSLQAAISETTKLSELFNNAGQHSDIKENKRGTIQDCRELHQSTLASLKKSLSGIHSKNSRKLIDSRTYLSAALTNKNTCLESLDSASGTLKPVLVNSVINTYKHVSNSLSMIPKPKKSAPTSTWFPTKKDLEISDEVPMLVVAADGTGNFSTISEAIDFAPNNSFYRTVIYVKEGVYEENVEIPTYKTNIVLLGDGSDVTAITGNRSVVDGWTTFRSATLGK